MTPDDEAERLRDDDNEWDDDSTREPHESSPGAACLVGTTTALASYPTAAQAFYACKPNLITGTETEGAAGTLTPGTKTFLALNLGKTVPPSGTTVICTFVENRWVFRYD